MDDAQVMLTIKEIQTNLKLDPSLKYMFVEGLRDLSFWRAVVPICNRINTQVIRVGSVTDLKVDCGGEKGKLLKLCELLEESGVSDRARFFVDSDNDRLLNTHHSNSVLLTDYRDLESYCFSQVCITSLLDRGMAKVDTSNVPQIISSLSNLCRKIGLLRFISEREQLSLPFSKTFEKNGRKKFNKANSCNEDKLVTTLLQNSSLGLSQKDSVLDMLYKAEASHATIDCKYIVQGKDWTFFLADLISVPSDIIESLIFLALDYNSVKQEPQINEAVQFLEAA
ncbi:DUF4435 domain-containing protein [Vibrio parahaemolyticus]|nr:DUF4435 domain-containing protein [Vibrio parahaemolyticus]